MTRKDADNLTATLVLMGAKRNSLVSDSDRFRLDDPEILIEIKNQFHGYTNPNDLIAEVKIQNDLAMHYDKYEFHELNKALEKITKLQKEYANA